MSFAETVQKARMKHGTYPIRAKSFLRFTLEASCMPLEVFLHSRFGIKYFYLPKAYFGILFLFVCMLLVNFGVSLHISLYPWNLGFIRVYPFVTLPDSWSTFWQNFTQAYNNFCGLFKDIGWEESTDIANFALYGYFITANLRWAGQWLRERSLDPVHPRSSGNPWPIWDPVYWLMYKLNIQSDLVKQLGEPLLCIALSKFFNSWLKTADDLSAAEKSSIQFISVWLGLGGILLILKAFLESRSRYTTEYDRRANEQDSLAMEAAWNIDKTKLPPVVTSQPKLD